MAYDDHIKVLDELLSSTSLPGFHFSIKTCQIQGFSFHIERIHIRRYRFGKWTCQQEGQEWFAALPNTVCLIVVMLYGHALCLKRFMTHRPHASTRVFAGYLAFIWHRGRAPRIMVIQGCRWISNVAQCIGFLPRAPVKYTFHRMRFEVNETKLWYDNIVISLRLILLYKISWNVRLRYQYPCLHNAGFYNISFQ